MPTPSDDTLLESPLVAHHERSAHLTCPPEQERAEGWGTGNGHSISGESRVSERMTSRPDELREGEDRLGPMDTSSEREPPTKVSDTTPTREREHDSSTMGQSSPAAAMDTESKACDAQLSPLLLQSPSSMDDTSSTSFSTSNVRLRPNHTSSFLRMGSKFQGTQQSDKQIYKVEVEIKHVDMDESFLCGYLRIEGLTEEHLVLTTYFEGEIIGPKYTFQTKHESWGATDKTDMHHWNRFPAWRPLATQAKKPDFHYKNCAQRENIFMRWKEYFLVPDHRVREISGASFEGFYYICFNQVEGTVSGIYFHSKSENRYQQLELQHVNDKGCLAAVEFR